MRVYAVIDSHVTKRDRLFLVIYKKNLHIEKLVDVSWDTVQI